MKIHLYDSSVTQKYSNYLPGFDVIFTLFPLLRIGIYIFLCTFVLGFVFFLLTSDLLLLTFLAVIVVTTARTATLILGDSE
jgi:hypothetical protein